MTQRSIGLLGVLGHLRNLFSSRDVLTSPDSRARHPVSIFIRHVDAGSCNDAEMEITALANPFYDLERFGLHIVSSPRHADVLLLTGPITRSMAGATLAAFHAMPEPRRVVTVGDGLADDTVFGNSYAIVPLPQELAAARVTHVPGDPPSPQQILDVMLSLKTQ